MLLLTRRPMMFLLGIGSFLDPAASVLRACISCYGWGGRLLEPNPAIFSVSPDRGSGSGRPGRPMVRRLQRILPGERCGEGCASGHPVQVGALLVAGTHPAVGRNRCAVPD